MLNLRQKVKILVKDGDDIVVDCEVFNKKLTKKEQKKVFALVKKGQAAIKEDAAGAMDEFELTAKMRFDLQISGENKETLKVFGEEYGYLLLMEEIDAVAEIEKGKQ